MRSFTFARRLAVTVAVATGLVLGHADAGSAGTLDAAAPRFQFQGSVKYVVSQLDPLTVGFKNLASSADQITYASSAAAPFVKPNGAIKWYGSSQTAYRNYSLVGGVYQWSSLQADTALGNGKPLQVLGRVIPVPGDGTTSRPFAQVVRLGTPPALDKHLDLDVVAVSDGDGGYTGRVVGPDFEGSSFTFSGSCTQTLGELEVAGNGTFSIGDAAGNSVTARTSTFGPSNKFHNGTITGGTGDFLGASGAASFVWLAPTCDLPVALTVRLELDLA